MQLDISEFENELPVEPHRDHGDLIFECSVLDARGWEPRRDDLFSEGHVCLFFDIETRPLCAEELGRIAKPFNPSKMDKKRPSENFEWAAPKNWVDTAKIEAKRIRDYAAWMQSVKDWDSELEQAETEYWSNIFEKAALDACLSTVCCVGFMKFTDLDTPTRVIHGDEQGILQAIWDVVRAAADTSSSLVGYNIFHFDLPYLIRRSWINDIPVPHFVFANRRWNDTLFVDVAQKWSMNQKQYVSLDVLSKAFALKGKRDQEVEGATFHEFWDADADKRQLAVEYLCSDLRLTGELAYKMGVGDEFII